MGTSVEKIVVICGMMSFIILDRVDAAAFSSFGSPRSSSHIRSPTAMSSFANLARTRPLLLKRPSLPLYAVPTTVSTVSEVINHWYLSYPYISACMTCSCKAGIADYIVQSTTTSPSPTNPSSSINLGRNIGFILYGGFYQGMFQQYMYATIFPRYFDGENVDWILSTSVQLGLDMLILGPFLCLPIAYLVQSLCGCTATTASSTNAYATQMTASVTSNVSTILQNGWNQYMHDVQYQNILTKYWCIWIPVKCLTFTLIPCHLRIVFIAAVSFFWMMMLSACANPSAIALDGKSGQPQ
jgi:Mpv17 / PMP22 family